VIGAVASYSGTAPAFGAVAGLAIVLFVAAALTPAAKPERPQPLAMLFQALGARRIRIGIWLVALPALLFGTLGVLAPLRLSHLGWSAAAVGATYLVSAAIEAAWSPILGRASDHYGRLAPLRAALLASAIVAALLPWPDSAWVLAFLVVAGGFAFGSFWTPAMSMVTDEAESYGLEYGYAFALVNIAWAPGQAAGAAVGGAIAAATSDAVSYLALAAVCVFTLAALARYRETVAPVAAER
jgi:MFS family permease